MTDNVTFDPATGLMAGDIQQSQTVIKDMQGLYEDEAARLALPQETAVYRVQSHCREQAGVAGGLFWGTSFLSPGLVGDEYFMTKGHFHGERETAEYYFCISGQGMLLLMTESGETVWKTLSPGALCYIPRRQAHRLVNTGDTTLAVGACWPSNAGHDYGSIRQKGFGVRVKKINGVPTAVPNQ